MDSGIQEMTWKEITINQEGLTLIGEIPLFADYVRYYPLNG